MVYVPYIVDRAKPLKIVVYLQRSSPLCRIRLGKTGGQMAVLSAIIKSHASCDNIIPKKETTAQTPGFSAKKTIRSQQGNNKDYPS